MTSPVTSGTGPEMDHATIWRKMADKWFEIAQETTHPALRKCYRDKALRFRAMAVLAEDRRAGAVPCPKAAPPRN